MIFNFFKKIQVRFKLIEWKIKYTRYNYLYHSANGPLDEFFREKRDKAKDKITLLTNELVGLKYGEEYVQWKLKQQGK